VHTSKKGAYGCAYKLRGVVYARVGMAKEKARMAKENALMAKEGHIRCMGCVQTKAGRHVAQ
jgi:hypothetical protein